MTSSELRPSGSVERECSLCHWRAWFDPLAPQATVIPYVCKDCVTNPIVGFKCTACNRHDRKPHRELAAERDRWTHHCQACIAEGVAYRSFAKIVYCWSCSSISPDHGALTLATQIKRYPNPCDCESCWQKFFHVCDACAADWIHDLSNAEYKKRLRARGAIILEMPDGGWTFKWPEPTLN